MLFTCSLLLVVSSVFARVVQYDFDVENGQVAPDGVPRNAVLVNGQFPGPLVTANKGDIIQVAVKNKLTDPTMRRSTTIHWHGLVQRRTADEDGPAFVTQCPIAPQESYTYSIPLGDQTGTYWYHSHLSAQYVDGLRGPLIIYPEDPYQYLYDYDDEKTVFTLADWYHTPSQAIIASGQVSRTRFRRRPDSCTINGKGRYAPLGMTATPDALYTLKVERGKRYRLRVINASAVASFRFSVQGHKLTVIEADGVLTEPIEVDAFDILAGQRYSVILNADQAPNTYWINAPVTNVPDTDVQALLIYQDDNRSFRPPYGPYLKWHVSEDIIRYWQHRHGHGGRPGKNHHKSRSVVLGHSSLRYLGAGSVSPTQVELEVQKRQNDDTVVLDETRLIPLSNPGSPGGNRDADVVVPLNFGMDFDSGRWMINNISYVPPDVPTLLKILSDKDQVEPSDFTQGEHTVILPKDKVIEFNITGSPMLAITHPIHFHGHTFDVVQYGNSAPNYLNPPRRDVVGVTSAGVRIRFKTDNPGPWFLHCHIDWHLEEGFAMVFAEAPEAIKSGGQSIKPDPAWKKLCEEYGKLPKELQ